MTKTEARRMTLMQELVEGQERLGELVTLRDDLEEARDLLQVAATKTQQFLQEDLTNIVTAALASVPFKEGYEFVVDFVARRNTTECDLLFKRGDNTMHPLDSSGYGAADVASFALRVAYWKLKGDLRPVLIYDEPFSNLDKDKQPYAVEIMRRLSQEFGIQMVISSHETTLINGADKVFRVTMKDGESNVQEE